MAELSNKLKTFLARELQRQFTSLDNSVGLFIAGTNYTSSGVDSIEEEIKTRRQIQTLKLIDDDKASLMIPRKNWTLNTIYEPYSFTADNSSRNFYVYTTEGNVYICISNGGGKKSIEEPSGTGTNQIQLSNGYVWKFMYKIPENLRDFVSETYIPIQELPFYENKPFPYDGEKQLQYSVQFNATAGALDVITVATRGSEYPNTIKASANHKVRSSSSTVVELDPRASSTNDAYNNYSIRIVSGTGVGQIKKITDYVGSTKKATVETVWGTIPDQTSKYEIIPTVVLTGDGTGAEAFVKMHSYAANTIESVVVSKKGSGYTSLSATISPTATPTATVLSVSLNPTQGLGRNPLFDLFAKRLTILTKLEGRENQKAVLGNDYRQYGLWFAPKINKTYGGADQVVGTETYLRTKVDVEASGTTFSDNFVVAGDFVFGSQSYNMGRVSSTSPFTRFGTSKGQITLDGLNSKLKNGELIYVFKSNNADGTPSGGFTFVNKNARVLNTLLEDSVRASSTDVYRCSHKLSIGRNDGNSFDPGTPYRDISFDSGVTGGSGSRGTVLDFINVRGSSGDLFVTNVFPGSSADTTGFTGGETLSANNGTTTIELTIESFSPPELNLFSGQLLYITSIEQVTRNAEQLDLFRINLDF